MLIPLIVGIVAAPFIAGYVILTILSQDGE
ncbi:hypothetical protein PBI_REDNO2_41 [Mycobacterium phage Redno2]|nr:hypothetical protein N860_gp041 [Mycobacterium phage Redno2]AGS82340.1 hypothetical protein PBI_REDNO2_41 [Mycobacterium phage Redno2]QDP43987.1 hypothetical protein SEA_DALLAS_44 [Mycobacterium phage Dallas]